MPPIQCGSRVVSIIQNFADLVTNELSDLHPCALLFEAIVK